MIVRFYSFTNEETPENNKYHILLQNTSPRFGETKDLKKTMERERKRIRNEPEIRRQVHQVMAGNQGNAWQLVLERMEMTEIFFADHTYPDFAAWLDRRNVWQAIWKYKVIPMLKQVEEPEVSQVGLNARWNCMAWYFTYTGSCEEYVQGYWIESISRPATQESVRLSFQKVIDYTGAWNGMEPQLVQLELSVNMLELRNNLLDVATNKNFRTLRSQVVWKVASMSDYFKTVAQVLYVLLREGFYIVLRFKEDRETFYPIRRELENN